jgi:hypothetical protein
MRAVSGAIGIRFAPSLSVRNAFHGVLNLDPITMIDITERRPIAVRLEDAENALSHIKRRGIPMILREAEGEKSKTFSFAGVQKIVQHRRKDIGLPMDFIFDTCRPGGTTELEEVELTEGQGRALSVHQTRQS